jgi:hypothetical protein
MSTQPRTAKPKTAPVSAESRTALLPCMSPAPPPTRPPTQLAFALALDQPDDQLVMPGCEDAEADPRRIYHPPTDAAQATDCHARTDP